MGSGWQENEHEAYGIPFGTMRERLERLDEACHVMRSLWTDKRSTFKGRFYQLSDAPLEPKAVQKPYPELMIGGGGEKVTLRIAARHADHWNVWGGPATLTHKGRILDQHCAAVGRDPKTILRSAVMVLGFADDRAGVEKLERAYMQRMGADAEKARDTVLAGGVGEIKDKLARLQAAGVGMLFVPTFLLPADRRPTLDRFMAEVAPAFR
jgi:alkanesulfonate monooxygenase SsuD/methylene tetrahydromethanopterin reductase-like flavin-dependent oxidoreductase (luciferase family)